jgi:hypothetical protein
MKVINPGVWENLNGSLNCTATAREDGGLGVSTFYVRKILQSDAYMHEN